MYDILNLTGTELKEKIRGIQVELQKYDNSVNQIFIRTMYQKTYDKLVDRLYKRRIEIISSMLNPQV